MPKASIISGCALALLLLLPNVGHSDEAATVLVLGDSLSAAHNIPAEAGWVNLLRRRLQGMESAWRVANASVSGETTGGGLARLPALLRRFQPSIVMVELGANDALRGFPVDVIRANLEEIIRLSRDAGANVVLLGIQIPINYGRRYRDQFGAMYESLASELDLPFHPFLLTGVALDADLMQADGLHPTADAQTKILENVWPVFSEAAGFTPSPRAAK